MTNTELRALLAEALPCVTELEKNAGDMGQSSEAEYLSTLAFRITAHLSAHPATAAQRDDAEPVVYSEDQWWFKELLAAAGEQNASPDLKRAVFGVVRGMIAMLSAAAISREPLPVDFPRKTR